MILRFSFCLLIFLAPQSLFAQFQLAPGDSIESLTVYTNPRCGYCVKLEKFLSQNNYKYKSCDITSKKYCYQEFVAKGGRGTPFAILQTSKGEQKISGFNQSVYSKIVKHSQKSSGEKAKTGIATF